MGTKENVEELARAAFNGDLAEVKRLIENEGVDINAKHGKLGFTALHSAVQEGKKEIVEYLIKKGANVNLTNKEGGTALHIAAFNSTKDMVQTLIEKGADVNLKNKHGATALHLAAYSGVKNVVEYLMNNGADVDLTNKGGHTALHIAALYAKKDVIEALKEKVANINALDKRGRTPLHYAAMNAENVSGEKKAEAAKALIEAGADLTLKDKDQRVVGGTEGETAMHYAAKNGNAAIVEAIHEKNPEVIHMKTSWRQFTPLHLAAGNGNKEVATWLLENRADINAIDNVGRTPIHHAEIESGPYRLLDASKKESIRYTIDAVVNKMNELTRTELHKAAIEGKVKEIQAFSGNINVPDWQGLNPLHFAAAKGQVEAIEALVEKGAFLEARDQWGHTPLHYAAECGQKAALEKLLAKGADIKAKNKGGKTPAQLAEKAGHKELAEGLNMVISGDKTRAAKKKASTPKKKGVVGASLAALATRIGKLASSTRRRSSKKRDSEGAKPLARGRSETSTSR